jgi:hypothetical protein
MVDIADGQPRATFSRPYPANRKDASVSRMSSKIYASNVGCQRGQVSGTLASAVDDARGLDARFEFFRQRAELELSDLGGQLERALDFSS